MSDSYTSADYERAIFQALVNEGKHGKVLAARKSGLSYNEKELRDAAHAEVASNSLHFLDEPSEKVSRKRKNNLNADEKAQQSRDRNREHAKNTRLRKKAYVVKLKELVDEMTRQREIEEKERKIVGERILNSEVIKKQRTLLFLSYRADNERDLNRWESLLEADFTFRLPITPYRSFLKGEVRGTHRIVSSVQGMIRDTASIALMLQCVGQGSGCHWEDILLSGGGGCKLTYHVARHDILVMGDLAMCRYLLKVDNMDKIGLNIESSCFQPGMLQCRFNQQTNRIVSAEMIFDVMGFMQQLQRSGAILPEQSIVPNTLEMALQPSNEPRAVMKVMQGGFSVLHVNLAWTQLTRLTQSEAEGCSFPTFASLFTTAVESLSGLAGTCAQGIAGSAIVPVHRTNAPNQARWGYVKMIPLSAEVDQVSHVLITFTVIERTVLSHEDLRSMH